MSSKSQPESSSYGQEKADIAIGQSYTTSSDPESGSPPSLPLHKNKAPSPPGQENANDTSKNNNSNVWLHRIVFFRFVIWWIMGAIVLVVLLALSGTILRTAHIRNVRLLGFFFWLAISWCSLSFSYITSWALGYFWFYLCQEDRLDFDDYQTFVVDIRHSIMLFLWVIISWAIVPLFCVLDQRRCTDHWVSVFHKVLLVTFIFAFVFLVKSFFLERLFIKAAIEYMSWKQKELEKSFYAIVILLPVLESRQSIGDWMKAMRTWSTHKRTRAYTLEEENDLEQFKSDPPPSPKDTVLYVADIFQGNGSKDVYKGLLSAIWSNRLHIPLNYQDHSRHTRSDGFYKKDIDDYLRNLHDKPPKCNKDYSLALRKFKDGRCEKGNDILWSRLKAKEDKEAEEAKECEFVTFKELQWQIKYLGESLREVVEGQKNLREVVHSLNIRASLFLCIPVAVIYLAIFTKDFAVYFSPLWTAFFGISFAIQDPVKEFVSACIFVFAQHPYDVGDLVILEDEKDLKLVATEIYLMHTTFQPVGGGKEYHIPHTKLSKECIENLCRPDSHISVVLHLKFKEIPQNIEKMKMKRKIQKRLKRKLKKEVSKIQDSETEDSETDDSETDDSETEDSEPNAFKHYQKHQTLRLYKMPRVTLAAVKEEDFVEGGIQVEFKVKPQTAWIPRTFYPYTKGFRDEVLHYVRCRLEKVPGLIKSYGTENEKSD